MRGLFITILLGLTALLPFLTLPAHGQGRGQVNPRALAMAEQNKEADALANMTFRELNDLITESCKEDPTEAGAQKYYQMAFSLPTEGLSDDEQQALAAIYSNYGAYMLLLRNNSQGAYDYLMRAMNLMKAQEKNGFSMIGLYIHLATLYANYNDYGRALSLIKEGFHKNLNTSAHNRISYLVSYMNPLAFDADSLLSISRERRMYMQGGFENTPMYEYNRLQNLGIDLYLKGDYANAARQFAASMEHLDGEYNNDRNIANAYFMAARSCMKGGDYTGAKRYIDLASQVIPMDYPDFDMVRSLTALKIDYYNSLGRTDLARATKYDLLFRQDSLYNASKFGVIKEMESDVVKAEINEKLQNSVRESRALASELEKNRLILAIIVGSLLIILALLLWIARKNKMLNLRNRDLYKKVMQLADTTVPAPEPAQPETPGEESVQEAALQEEAPQEEGAGETEDLEVYRPVFERIREFCATSREIYNPDFSVDTLARMTDLKVNVISKAINKLSGKNFGTFLATYRIMEACRMLAHPQGKTAPTIEYVAEKVGYRSRSYFSRLFKAETGLTTTEFIRQSRLDHTHGL